MSGAARPTPLTSPTRTAVLALAATQLIGWGTTYYLPAVLSGPMGRDLGLSRELVFAGVTIMLVVGALVAPRAGVLQDSGRVRGLLVLGSGFMGAALVVLAAGRGWGSYVAAWVLIGLGMPLALTQGALAALSRVAGGDARRAFATMFLMSGFSATVFWPLTAALEGAIGWRGTCLVFAGLNLAVCAPLHWLATSPRLALAPVATAGGTTTDDGTLPPDRARVAFAWCALAFAAQGFVSWGLPLNLIEILKALGHPAAIAVGIAALLGPAQVAARFAETLFGPRIGILRIGLMASLAAPLAVALPLGAGASLAVAGAFVIGYGLSAGAFTIVRAVVPLTLFGRARYATMMGRLAVPQNVAFAAAPPAFAAALDAWGPAGALWLALAGTLAALAAVTGLMGVGRG